MAKHSYPVALTGELRGIEPPRSFTDRDTGEAVNLGPVLKIERPDGDDVTMVYIRVSDRLDVGSVDVGALKRGDHLTVTGEVVLYDDRPGYFRALAIARQTANGRTAQQA